MEKSVLHIRESLNIPLKIVTQLADGMYKFNNYNLFPQIAVETLKVKTSLVKSITDKLICAVLNVAMCVLTHFLHCFHVKSRPLISSIFDNNNIISHQLKSTPLSFFMHA